MFVAVKFALPAKLDLSTFPVVMSESSVESPWLTNSVSMFENKTVATGLTTMTDAAALLEATALEAAEDEGDEDELVRRANAGVLGIP